MAPKTLGLIIIFLTYYSDLRDLHSFPTRRSSDLLLGLVRGRRLRRLSLVGAEAAEDHRRERAIHRAARSEEHTSELQSQFHIVCRLLLEKKKTDLGKELACSRCVSVPNCCAARYH